jgi:hypothetical protein
MDLIIVVNACIFFGIFYILHLVVLRLIPNDKIFDWSFIIIFCSIILSLPIYIVVLRPLFINDYAFSFTNHVFILIFIVGLSALMMVEYIFFIFGSVLESSIKVKLLDLISHNNKKGLTRASILQKYNTDTILHKRLNRLSETHVLSCINSLYSIRKLSFPITCHQILIDYFRKTYQS